MQAIVRYLYQNLLKVFAVLVILPGLSNSVTADAESSSRNATTQPATIMAEPALQWALSAAHEPSSLPIVSLNRAAVFHSTPFGSHLATIVTVGNVEELYSAVNDAQNEGSVIVAEPGVYLLSANGPGDVPRPNGGRLELQYDMSLVGVVGDREAVVIDAINLPVSSYQTGTVPNTGAIRMGRGVNSVEWLTVRNAVNGTAGIETDVLSNGTSYIRIAHIKSTGNSRGIDVRNFGSAMAGRVIEAEIVDNDLHDNQIVSTGGSRQGLRIINAVDATGAAITVRMRNNRLYNNHWGIIVTNNIVNQASISVTSFNDAIYGNGLGGQIVGGLFTADQNSTAFTASRCKFQNNNGPNDFDQGGLLVVAGANNSIPNGTSNNTVSVTLQNCQLSNNQFYDLAAIGARSNPVDIGPPGANNHVVIKLSGTQIPNLVTADSIPDYPKGMNSATVTNTAPVSISGRVVTANGHGIYNAIIAMTDVNGIDPIRRVRTSPFGYFRFENVVVGEEYLLSSSAKRYVFTPNPILIQVTGQIDDLQIIGDYLNN